MRNELKNTPPLAKGDEIMDRLLTREQVEEWYAHANHALNNITVGQFRDLCDMALHLESVRSEALEEDVERCAEQIVQALHCDFTTYNKAKVLLLLHPLIRALSPARVAEGGACCPDGMLCPRDYDRQRSTQQALASPSPPESPAKEQPREQNTVRGDEMMPFAPPEILGPDWVCIDDKLDVASMVRRLREAAREFARDQAGVSILCQDAAALLAKLGQGWIPVTERLPDKNGYYLARRHGEHVSELCAHIFEDGKWRFGDGSDVDEFPVEHWMPLPLPPERP